MVKPVKTARAQLEFFNKYISFTACREKNKITPQKKEQNSSSGHVIFVDILCRSGVKIMWNIGGWLYQQ